MAEERGESVLVDVGGLAEAIGGKTELRERGALSADGGGLVMPGRGNADAGVDRPEKVSGGGVGDGACEPGLDTEVLVRLRGRGSALPLPAAPPLKPNAPGRREVDMVGCESKEKVGC